MKNKKFKVGLYFVRSIEDEEEFTVEAIDEKSALEKAKKLSSLCSDSDYTLNDYEIRETAECDDVGIWAYKPKES